MDSLRRISNIQHGISNIQGEQQEAVDRKQPWENIQYPMGTARNQDKSGF